MLIIIIWSEAIYLNLSTDEHLIKISIHSAYKGTIKLADLAHIAGMWEWDKRSVMEMLPQQKKRVCVSLVSWLNAGCGWLDWFKRDCCISFSWNMESNKSNYISFFDRKWEEKIKNKAAPAWSYPVVANNVVNQTWASIFSVLIYGQKWKIIQMLYLLF